MLMQRNGGSAGRGREWSDLARRRGGRIGPVSDHSMLEDLEEAGQWVMEEEKGVKGRWWMSLEAER